MTNDHMMSEVHLSTIEIRSVDRWKNKDLRTHAFDNNLIRPKNSNTTKATKNS